MTVALHDISLTSEGLVDCALFRSKDADVTWHAPIGTAKGGSHFLRFLYGAKLLRFGAFKRRFEPPECPVLLPTPGNSHQGAVPLRVRGYGKYSGSDRTIKLLNAKLAPGFPVASAACVVGAP